MEDLKDVAHTSSKDKVSFKERLEHFTWAWFTLPLSTAAIAILLATTPHRFDGLNTIGKIIFIFALVLYIVAIGAISTRFAIYPATLRCSFTHPRESLFFPTSILALANMIACAQIYGAPSCGPWLPVAIRVLFWIYMAVAFIASVLQYLQLFTGTTRLTIQGMTPAWILPVFPILFGAVLASIVASDQPPTHAFNIVVCGLTYLGVGWMVAILMTAIYLRRLMEFGLPAPDLRPGMFIAVGPPTFTGAALIGLANSLTVVTDHGYFVNNDQAVKVLQVMALFIAIFLWALGFWFFCMTLIAVLCGVRKMEFHLVWWAAVFPNVAFALATTRIGDQLESEGIMWVASAMTILLVAAWMFVIVANARAFWLRKITMPGVDEDRDCQPPEQLPS